MSEDIDGWRPGRFGAMFDSLLRLRDDACRSGMPVLAIAYGWSLLRIQRDYLMKDITARLTPPPPPQ